MILVRIISGVIGLATLIGTAIFAFNLLDMEPDADVFLAGYMVIGGLLVGALMLFYAINGGWSIRTRNQ